jgi:hypothetical protein
MEGENLIAGDRISVYGGYETKPKWLWGRKEVSGVVSGWIAREGRSPVCTVELDDPLPLTEVEEYVGPRTGKFLALKLRYSDAKWTDTEVVHVEIYRESSTAPESIDAWVESHASYRRLATTN